MRRILFGTLLALLLTTFACNQRPERDVPLDTSTEPLFLGTAQPCGTDSVAGWTDCDPQTNRPTRANRIATGKRVRIENSPLRPGTPKPSIGEASTKDGEPSVDPADLEIGVPSWSNEIVSEESESTSDEAFVPAFWQSENMPAFTASAALGASDAPPSRVGGGGGGGGAAGGAGLGSLSWGGGASAGQLSLPGGDNVPRANLAEGPTPTTVPEPSTIVLLAAGLILLGFMRLRVNLNRTDN